MGKIIRFPILVVSDKATEQQYGITPQLRSSIRALASASTEAVVSERGIRSALDGLTWNVEGENITSGCTQLSSNIFPIFNEVSGDNIITFNSLSGVDQIQITSDTDNVYINSIQPGDPNSITGTTLLNGSLNGGIEQEASKINYSDFDVTTGVCLSGFPAFHNVEAGDVIGKILIKCSKAFDDNSTMFSIGTSGVPSGFIEPFSVSGGVTTNKLVDVEYGTFMYDKVTYTEQNLSGMFVISSMDNLIDSNDILVYKYNGNSNTQGELQCVIFYDKMLDGVLIPGSESLNTIEYFQFSNYTTSIINSKLSTDLYGYAIVNDNEYVYIVGGIDNTSNYSSSIQKMSKSRLLDISVISSTLITSRAYFSSGSSSIAGYFFGGAVSPSTTTRLDSIEKLLFSTDTESDTAKTLTSAKQNITATNDWPKNTQSFIIGGQTSTDNVTEIDKYVYSTDTITDATNSGWTLINKLGHATSTGNQDYVWIFGGVDTDAGSVVYDTIQRLTIASGSGACSDRADLIAAHWGMGSSTNKAHTSSYIFGGRNSSNYFKTIEEYNHSNDTVNSSAISMLQEERSYIKGVQV